MRYRHHVNLMLVVIMGTAGCASSRIRPFSWLRNHPLQSQVAQAGEPDVATTVVESLSAAPRNSPPGIELPPASPQRTANVAFRRNATADSANAGVIFASVEGAQQ